MWAIVELMGHVRLAGYVTEEERFGAKLGRIDIHAKENPEIECDRLRLARQLQKEAS